MLHRCDPFCSILVLFSLWPGAFLFMQMLRIGGSQDMTTLDGLRMYQSQMFWQETINSRGGLLLPTGESVNVLLNVINDGTEQSRGFLLP